MFILYTIHHIYDNHLYSMLDKDLRKGKDVWPIIEFQITKTCPISEEMTQWCLFKSRTFETLSHIIFSFFIFMILSVKQLNMDYSLHNKTKRVMLGW